MGNFLKIVGAIVIIAILLVISPWLFFWLSYFGGWIAKLVIGKYLVEGFGLFGIVIPINKIPLIAGTLGWIGGFFKSSSVASSYYNNNKNNFFK